MNLPFRITDHFSNAPELIVAAAKAIGNSELKLKVFCEVYRHKQRVKSVQEIADEAGLDRMQVLKAGGSLKKSGLFGQGKKDKDTAYSQIEFYQHNKAKILRLVEDPSKIPAVITKRNPVAPAAAPAVNFVRPRKARAAKPAAPAKGGSAAKIRIAFLTTNPMEAASLRTDMEVRDVLLALKKSANRDQVEVRHIPAAQVTDLLDALNEFEPNIVHFSCHGGAAAVLFDNKAPDEDGGMEVDFDLVNEIISATATPPRLLVFNACDTLDGAEVFLDTVEAVIAMSDSIGDAAACFFAAQFYSALVSGQSLDAALKQGKIVLKAAKLADADLPSVICARGVKAGALTFI